MALRSENFKNIAVAGQAITVALAIGIGGLWTWYTFNRLEIPRLERELFQAEVDININAQHEILDDGRNLIAAIVEITNRGGRNAFLDYGKKPFSVQLFDSGDFIDVESTSAYRVLRSGETVKYPFVAHVTQPGLYIVRFQVPLSKVEEDEHWKVIREEGILSGEAIEVQRRQPGSISWVGSTFVNVSTR